MSSDPLVSIRGVTKVYQMGTVEVYALSGVDLDIERERFVVILGPSGSGKTTLLNLIGGVDTPTSGTILFDGRELPTDLTGLTEHRRTNIGFVFQFFNLIPTLTALENVEFALELVGVSTTDGRRDFSKQAIRSHALRLLIKVGLEERADHFPAELSGGEQQRVSIARALAKDPALIVADEPTGALDYRTGVEVLTELFRVREEEHKTVVVVTHNREIAKIADVIVELRDGRVGEVRSNTQQKRARELRW